MIYALCALIAVQQIIHHIERKDLYDRIMSKNLTEYKGDARTYSVSAHRKVLSRWKQKGGDEQ